MQPGGGPYAAGQHAYMSLVSKVGLANQVPPLKETGMPSLAAAVEGRRVEY